MLVSLYNKNIRWLQNNGLGLTYQEMNLLVYVFLFPSICLLLFWGIIRKKNE